MNGDGPLDFDAVIRETDFNRSIQNMERRIMGFSGTVQRETSAMDDTFSRLGQAAAGYFAFTELSQLPGKIVQVRGEFQQLEISFRTMLGNQEKADKLMSKTVNFAATTPYGLKDSASAVKQLLAYGESAETVTETLRKLGDIASGIGAPLGDIAYLYGTTMTQGRLYTQDLNQFTGRGIPMIKELAKIFKVAESEVKGLVEAGKVGFPEVQKVIENLTNSGSMFGGLMEAQSKSLPGLIAQFEDAVDMMINDIGRANEGLAAGVITGATGVVENYQEVIDILKVIVATYGTYKAALIAISVAQRLVAASSTATLFLEMARGLGTVTTATYAQAVALGIQTQAQAALNSVMAINPYVAAATAIVALSGAIWYLSDGTTAAELAQRSLSKIHEESAKKVEDLTAKTRELTAIVTSDSQTTYAQIQAYHALKAMYPDLLSGMAMHEFKAIKASDAQKMLNGAIDEMNIDSATKNFQNATKQVSDFEKRLENLIDKQKSMGAEGSGLDGTITRARKELEAAKIEAGKLGEEVKQNEKIAWEANTPVEEQVKHYENIKAELVKQRAQVEENQSKLQKLGGVVQGLQPFFNQLSLESLNLQIDQAAGKILALQGKPNVMFGGNKAYWEGEVSKRKESLAALGVNQEGSSEWKRLKQEIQEAENQLDKYSLKTKKVAEKDKPQPFGSIAYWDQVARKADEAMQKLPGTKTSRLNELNQIKVDAEREADRLRKSLTKTEVKTLNDELDEKRKLYELYYRWVVAYGEDVANKQFDSLISQHGGYLDYLNDQISKLEGMKSGPGLTDGEAGSLANLIGQRDELTGNVSPMEKFAKNMDHALVSSESLTEEILKLKEIQAGLDINDISTDGFAKRQQLQERINEAGKERSAQLKEFLVSVVGSEQKRLEIETHYKNLREALEAQYANNKGEAYKKALAAINDAEKAETAAFEVEKVKQSKGYQELERIIQLSTDEQTKIRLDAEKKKLAALEASNQKFKNVNKELTDDYIAQLIRVRRAEEEHKQKSVQMWGQIAGVVGQLGDVLQEMGGSVGEVGGALSGLSSQFGNISQAFQSNSDGSMSMNQYVAAIQGVIQIIGTLVSVSKQRAEAEKQFAMARLGFENDYALALNQQLGDNYKHNPFYQDYEGQIKAAVEQYKDAYKKYQDAVDKVVEEGRVKERQKNVVDGKTVGQLAGGGAAVGAGIGAAIGVWGFGVMAIVGAAVGAVIGGIVGAIGGLFAKKKKDVYGAIKEQYQDITDEMGNLNVEMAKALIANNQADDKTKQMLQNTIALHEEMEKARTEINGTMKDLTGEIGDNLRNALVNAFKEGKDAAEALRETVGAIISDVASKLLFSKLVGPVLDQLTEEMTKSLTEGDGTIIDDLDRFGNPISGYALAQIKAFEESEKLLDEWLKANGYDTIGGSSKKTALQGTITSASEESVSALNGQLNAVRIHVAETNANVRESLFFLAGIEKNTSSIDRNTSRLNQIETILNDIRDNTKSNGGGNSPRSKGWDNLG